MVETHANKPNEPDVGDARQVNIFARYKDLWWLTLGCCRLRGNNGDVYAFMLYMRILNSPTKTFSGQAADVAG